MILRLLQIRIINGPETVHCRRIKQISRIQSAFRKAALWDIAAASL